MDGKPVITKLDIAHYRGINGLTLDNLSRVNILTGPNNSGKTSVLEAVSLTCNLGGIVDLIKITNLRTGSTEGFKNHLTDYLLSIFQQDDTNRYLLSLSMDVNRKHYSYRVTGKAEDSINTSGIAKKTLTLEFETAVDKKPPSYHSQVLTDGENVTFNYRQNALAGGVYINNAAKLYSDITSRVGEAVKRGEKSTVLKLLQSFDSDVQDFSVIDYNDIYLEHAKKRPLPLFSYGSGMQKAFFLAVEIGKAKDGVLMIDEIDNSIHTSEYETVFGWFIDTCIQYNIQAFLTTHSAEALDAFLEAAHQRYPDEDLLRVITLRRDEKPNVTRKLVRTGEGAYQDRMQFEQELRV